MSPLSVCQQRLALRPNFRGALAFLSLSEDGAELARAVLNGRSSHCEEYGIVNRSEKVVECLRWGPERGGWGCKLSGIDKGAERVEVGDVVFSQRVAVNHKM